MPSTTGTATATTSENNSNDADTSQQQQQKIRQEELEARAVDKAKMSADAAFRPSPSIFNAPSAQVLLQQVDGVNLQLYDAMESIYVGRSVPIIAGGSLNVPINVATPGSVVSYAIELKQYDINFAITAEREEGITVVKEKSRIGATTNSGPITQKFLVGTVPCLLQFDFTNEYSWMREKIVSYKITVTPPSRESLAAGRRRRAHACMTAVEDDLQTALRRLETTTLQKNQLSKELMKLTAALEDTKKAVAVAEKEVSWLQERKTLRLEQQALLKQRLTKGWSDEVALQQKQNGSRK